MLLFLLLLHLFLFLLLLLIYLIITYALHSFEFGFVYFLYFNFLCCSESSRPPYATQNIVKRWNPAGVSVAWPCPVAAASRNLRFSKPKRIPS